MSALARSIAVGLAMFFPAIDKPVLRVPCKQCSILLISPILNIWNVYHHIWVHWSRKLTQEFVNDSIKFSTAVPFQKQRSFVPDWHPELSPVLLLIHSRCSLWCYRTDWVAPSRQTAEGRDTICNEDSKKYISSSNVGESCTIFKNHFSLSSFIWFWWCLLTQLARTSC